MKKSLSLLVAIAMVFSMFATSVFAADEKTTEQKYDELVKAGIFAGLPGGEAGLDQTMTRAQAAVIVAKLAGFKEGVTSPDAGFTDVPAGHWAKAYVDFAANLGIISGVGAGKFDPKSEVTIQELAKLAVDALAKLGYTLKDAVAVEGTVAEWAKEYVGKAIANGIFAAQADYTIPALRGLLVTASYSAYEALQVPAAIVVESVKATNSRTLFATFNVEVGTAVASNFTVHTKDDVYALNVVNSVTVDGKTVKITLNDQLDEETTYVLVAEGVTSAKNDLVLASVSKEVTYKATEAASIAFAATAVGDASTAAVVIKDADGNDVTADYIAEGTDISTVLEVESSNISVIDEDLDVNYSGTDNKPQYVIVNAKIVDTKIETGNTIIAVYETLKTATQISSISFDADKEDLSIFKSVERELLVKVLDQNGDPIPANEVTYKLISQNPKVAVVDQEDNLVYGVKAGTATILVQATYNGKTVSKTVTVTVKDDAKISALKLELPNSKLVIGSGLSQDLKVTLLDQYGDDYKVLAGDQEEVSIKINKDKIVKDFNKADEETVVISDSASDVLTIFPSDATDVKAGTATITASINGVSKTISVSLVTGGSLAGYAAVVKDTTLDISPNSGKSEHKQNEVTISVYAKDASGNLIGEAPAGVVVKVIDAEGDNATVGGSVEVNGLTVSATNEVGTETVTVMVDGLKAATIKFTVVDSEPAVTKVVQLKNAINFNAAAVNADLVTTLFGADKEGGAFVAYNQYGEKIVFTVADIQVFTSKSTVIDRDLDVIGNGTAVLTFEIAGSIYTITVNVTGIDV